MSDKDSDSDSYWYDIPPFPLTPISKKPCLVKFLEIPGHPIIGFSRPEGFVEGSTCRVRIPPDILPQVLNLNKADKAPPASYLGLEVKWSLPSDASDADSFTTTIEGPSDNAKRIESLPLSIDEQPRDSLPSSIPMVYGNVSESQMTQTTLDHQELMRDMEVYRQYWAQGVIASPTLYQLSQPDSEEEAQLAQRDSQQEDEDDMNLLKRVDDLVDESKAESTLELSLLNDVPAIAPTCNTTKVFDASTSLSAASRRRAATSNSTKMAAASTSLSTGKRSAETSSSTTSRTRATRAATSHSTKKAVASTSPSTGKRKVESSSSKKAAASPSTSKKRPATSPPTTSPNTRSRATFARGQAAVTATAETTSPSVATSPIVVRQARNFGLLDYDVKHETITNPSGLTALRQEELEAEENEDVVVILVTRLCVNNWSMGSML
jgi:hypothetical protein